MSSSSVLFDAPGPKARVRNRILSIISLVTFAAFAWWIISVLADQGQFEAAKWKPFIQSEIWSEYLVPGLINTVKAAAISIVLAAVLGLVLALARMSALTPLRWAAGVFVEFFRAVPVLMMMIFTWGLFIQTPSIPPDQAPLLAVVTALTLYNGSVMCEVVRAGVGQLPAGQREAGLSVGLSEQQTLRTILLPQAITAMLPSLVSQLVVVLKDTALGFNVTYLELLRSGTQAESNYTNLVPVLIVVATIYIIINYAVTKLAEYIEGRLKRRGLGRKGTTGAAGSTAAGPDMAFNRETG
ncbi:amino acid ABC transporter permease [Demetria terragena]|uniref:amino acid ABC transporter permease n=1 Tax=Demetria terragena TaxID=63959 RepID=UPI00035D0A00|nr:amino acid ABC transporter permease [Demetria terragena]